MIEIFVFGSARAHDAGRGTVLTDFQGVKPRQVLNILALNQACPMTKDRLADVLWQGSPPSSWISTLEGYVSLLRQSLQRGVAARDSVVLTRGAGYRLDPSRVWIDVAHFDDLVGQAATAPAELALARYCEALALVTGEICESERTTPWIIEARDRYHERVRRAATAAGRLALRQGHAELAADFGRRACELDPLAEEGWQILIEAHWRAERRTEALRSFSSVRALLHRELGVLPGRALQQLYTEVLRDEQVFQVA